MGGGGRRGAPIRGRVSRSAAAEAPSVREAYVSHPEGASGWYAASGADYRNPHEAGIVAATAALAAGGVPSGRVLDLACGSGEWSLAMVAAGVDLARIDAVDPFTAAAYRARTGREAARLDFEAIARGGLGEGRWGLVGCSFALHLCPDTLLPAVCLELARRAEALWIFTPHKRPELRASWGWRLEEERYNAETRVRSRRYARA